MTGGSPGRPTAERKAVAPQPPRWHLVRGQVLGRRYRIHHPVGAGSMGVVYRADDTKLGKLVVLKASTVGGGVDRSLRREVTAAQEVSHPNVCRVFDLIVEGELQLASMEFIDGPTLEQILARGEGLDTLDDRLQIAFGLCAGLEAIHTAGLAHRDLKPANILRTAEGRTVITDLGLADFGQAALDPGSGTWQYMAPEQLEASEASPRSDLFALGVVLFELFTGQHPFPCERREELAALQRQGPCFPTGGPRLGNEIESVITWCLELDPDKRPPSPWHVARELPADHLRPAAGRPVPVHRLLAAPGRTLGGLLAWSLLGVTLLTLVLGVLLGDRAGLLSAQTLGRSPEWLEERAGEILVQAGYDEPSPYRISGWAYTPTTVSSSDAGQLSFWTLQSPRRLMPRYPGSVFHHPRNLLAASPGTVGVEIDTQGQLLCLEAVPEDSPRLRADSQDPGWRQLFTLAGLALDHYREVDPEGIPRVFADQRSAWERVGAPGTELVMGEPTEVEGAALDGRPVIFRAIDACNLTRGDDATPRIGPPLPTALGRWIFGLWDGAVLTAVVLLAWASWRKRTADPTAALRVAVFLGVARLLAGLLAANHPGGLAERTLVKAHLTEAVGAAALVWLVYLALEPRMRFWRARQTAPWVRWVYGRLGDPLVGRSLLVGACSGATVALWAQVYSQVPPVLGLPMPRLDRLGALAWQVAPPAIDLQLEALRGPRHALAMMVYSLVHSVLVAFSGVVGLVLCHELLARSSRRLLRHETLLPRLTAWVLLTLLLDPSAGPPALDLLAAAVSSGLWLYLLIRHGFLAALTATVCAGWLGCHPLTFDLGSWYLAGSTMPLLGVLGFSIYGLVVSRRS